MRAGRVQVGGRYTWAGMRPGCWQRFLLRALLLGTVVGARGAAYAQCKASPELEARLRAKPTAAVLTERGTWFGERGQFRCANESFRAALKAEPGSAKVNYFLGFSLYSGGEKEAALAPLAVSSRLDPRALQPHLLRGAILDELHRPREAQAEWKAALALNPASTEALDGLSKNLIDGHDPFAAISLLRDAKRDEDLNLDLASAYGNAGMLDESAATVKEALARDPGSLRLTKALATVYIHQQRYQDATDLLRSFLEKNPGDTQAETQYLGALVLTNDQKTALPLADKLFAAAPHDFDVLYLKGILEKGTDAYPAAREHLREAVTLQPENPSARYQLGATLAHLNDLAGAREQLEKAIALSPTTPDAHFQLAGVLRSLGDSAGAQQQLAAFQKLKQDGLQRAEADSKAHQARERLAAGDVAQAVELYRQAVAATPANGLLQYQFALALDQAKNTAEEREALQKALAIDPTFALAANQLGYLQSNSGDLPGAEASFRRAVTAVPEFTAAWINLAATLAAESHYKEAQQSVATALKLEPGNPEAQQLRQKLLSTHP